MIMGPSTISVNLRFSNSKKKSASMPDRNCSITSNASLRPSDEAVSSFCAFDIASYPPMVSAVLFTSKLSAKSILNVCAILSVAYLPTIPLRYMNRHEARRIENITSTNLSSIFFRLTIASAIIPIRTVQKNWTIIDKNTAIKAVITHIRFAAASLLSTFIYAPYSFYAYRLNYVPRAESRFGHKKTGAWPALCF